jgi:hypothetical protein
MRSILVSVVIAGLATGALAQPEPTTLTMTCAQAKRIVSAQGAAVLHTGPTTYDRYVRDSSFCALQETAQPIWVRTADVVQCPIGAVCRSIEIDNGR